MKTFIVWLLLATVALGQGVTVPTTQEFESLESRVKAIEDSLATPPPVEPDCPEEPEPPVIIPLPPPVVLDPTTLQFLGGYRVPSVIVGDKSMAFSHCGITGDGESVWMTHHAVSSAVIRLTPPASRGTNLSQRNNWPIASHADTIANAYLEVRNKNWQHQAFGVHYVDGKLLVSGRDIYATGPQQTNWLVPIEINPVSVLPAIDPGLSPSRFGGGFVTIPQAFADQYCGGNRIGLSLGGYESGQGSSHTPTLASFGTAPKKILMDSIFGAPRENREQRDGNYSAPSNDAWFLPPVDGVGVWTTDRVLGTAWVDTSTVSSFVALVAQPTGTMNYGLQNPLLAPGAQYRFYVYDPADLAKVAQGQLAPNRVRGKWYPVPWIGGGTPQGMYWDGVNQRLCIVYQGAWNAGGIESYPIVAEFEVGQ